MTFSLKWPWGKKAGLGTDAPPTLLNEVDGSEMILIPAGAFLRGSPAGEGTSDEWPQREIYLDAFYISRKLVTNRQYRKFIEQTRHPAPPFLFNQEYNHDDQPIVGVTWEDAQAYCKWAGLRLPTEAEWEKAAGWDEEKKQKRRWPWGAAEPGTGHANFGNKVGRTSPVGSYPSGGSAYGCLDLAGNVREWLQDWFDDEYYTSAPAKNPGGPSKGTMKAVRGGSFFSEPEELRVSYRFYLEPGFSARTGGFRCVRSR